MAGVRTQKTRRERTVFAASDENVMMKQIQATHAPDGREFSVKLLLRIVEEIFHHATPAPDITDFVQHQGSHEAQLDELEEKVLQNGFNEMIDMLSYTISKISCEIHMNMLAALIPTDVLQVFWRWRCTCNNFSNIQPGIELLMGCKGGASVSCIRLELWLVSQLFLANPLAKAVALLKQLPEIIEQAEALKPKFEAITNLIRAMTDVAKCIVEFKELPSQYITPDTPEMLTATAHIPTAVYWTIRSIVACTSQIVGLTSMGHEYIASTTEAWELSGLAYKVSNIHSHLVKQLTLCFQHIDEKRHHEAYLTLVRLLESVHIDNMKILKALIYAKDDQLPLFDGSTKKRASLDLLRRKSVLLLISDLEPSQEEFLMLQQIYSEAREQPGRAESQYEIVWLPVMDRFTQWNETKKKQFEDFQSSMPWYSVYHPSLLDVAVIRYIKEVWHFNKKPLLVVLDPLGKVVNPNAIHMMWIWGSLAFPFTSLREEGLWKEETWKIDLLADNIDPAISSWIEQWKFICLYGGEDIEWIRKFTATAKAVAKDAGIQLEMLYVGKSNPKEKARKINGDIVNENLSNVLPDLTLIWFFWVRLESMWHSKVQHKSTADNDPIMQEIMTMLSFDGSGQGWAVISKGSDGMAKAKGDTILKSFVDFESWKQSAEVKGFLPALNDHLHELHSPSHCNRLILPGATGSIPEKIVCAECGRPMEKFIMYRCCTD